MKILDGIDPNIVIDEAAILFAKYGLKLNRNKCLHTDPNFSTNFGNIKFCGVTLTLGGYQLNNSLSDKMIDKATEQLIKMR